MVGLNFFSIAPVYGNESKTKDNKDYWFEKFCLKANLNLNLKLMVSLNPSNGCMAIYSAQI